jgi:hypothetical protein
MPTLLIPVIALICFLGGTADAQSIWFAPQPRPDQISDYMSLFRPGAPWQAAASRVDVFQVGGKFLLKGPEDDLRQMFSELKRRHLGLQVGIEPLTAPERGPGSCAYRIEGYGGPPALTVARRLKELGGEPQFFGMDEPLYFGHVFGPEGGKRGCHEPIAEIARDVADKVKLVRSVFPGVPFGDTEPLTFRPRDPWFQNDAWLHDLSDWFDAYEAATGEKLAYLRLDLWWNMPWGDHMPALTALLARKGIPLQVIYNGNGNGNDRTDESWNADAVAHFKAFESGPWPRPAAAVFQYWTPYPTHILPESDPLTATGLIDRYVQWQRTRQ